MSDVDYKDLFAGLVDRASSVDKKMDELRRMKTIIETMHQNNDDTNIVPVLTETILMMMDFILPKESTKEQANELINEVNEFLKNFGVK